MSKKQSTPLLRIVFGVLLARGAVGLARGSRRLAWRWRRVLTPLWVGLVVWSCAVLVRGTAGPEWFWVPVLLPVLGVVLAVLGPRLGDRYRTAVMVLVPDGLDKGKSDVLDRPAERTYLAVLLTWVGAYLALRIGDGSSVLSGTLWQLGVLVLGGIWWWHRRIRVAGKADRYARRWGKITRGETNAIELRPLMGSKVTQVKSYGAIAKLRVKLAAAVTQTQAERCQEALASYMPKMRPNSVFFARDEHSAQHVWYTFIPQDPWKGKIPHPLVESPPAEPLTLASKGKRFAMGVKADATEMIWKLQHAIFVGQTGAGKSILLESLLLWLMAFRDVCLVGIDMAGGATLGMYRRVLALPLATDEDQAKLVLAAVLDVVRDRERSLDLAKQDQDDAADEFQPSQDHPWLVLIIDEFPDLIAAGGKDVAVLIGRIGKRARKCGVRILVLSQNGSKEDVGSKEFQAQLSSIFGLPLDVHASKVLWGNLERQGWVSSQLKTGQFLLRDPDHQTPEITKGFFVSTRDRKAKIQEAVDAGRPMLEPSAWAALTGTQTMEGMVIDMEMEPEPEQLDPVLTYLRDEGPASAAELEKLPGMPSRATIFRYLRAGEVNGRCHSRGGTWHWGAPEQGEQAS
jgi:hypothetical protein